MAASRRQAVEDGQPIESQPVERVRTRGNVGRTVATRVVADEAAGGLGNHDSWQVCSTPYNPPMSSLPHAPGLLRADTDAASEQQQIERWRVMTPAEKFRVVGELNAAVDAMAVAGIRSVCGP